MNLIIILIVLVSLLLMLVILAQNAKGGGLSSQFGGGGTSQVVGVKRTSDLLEKITWGLAIALIALTLSTAFFLDRGQRGITSPNIERAREQQVVPGLGGSELQEEEVLEEVPVQEEQPVETGVEASEDTDDTDLD